MVATLAAWRRTLSPSRSPAPCVGVGQLTAQLQYNDRCTASTSTDCCALWGLRRATTSFKQNFDTYMKTQLAGWSMAKVYFECG
eukprot:6206464-Pleurochrysis_carterae.AAC.1